MLVPSLHVEELNPHIDFARGPFMVQREAAQWRRPVLTIDGHAREYPRIAGISSFGAGGSNAHVLIEEYRAGPEDPGEVSATGGPVIVVLSAKDEERLAERVQRLIEALESGRVAAGQLASLAYTLQTGREAMEERLAFIVHSVPELVGKLRRWAAGEEAIEEVYCGDARRNREMLSALAGDDGLARLVDSWVEKRNYARLIELWVKGLAFDWNRLYGESRPRRMSLPGYPFSRRRIWISPSPERSRDERTEPAPRGGEEKDPLDSLVDAVIGNAISITDAVARAEQAMSASA